jgi:hypothetical protein
MGTMTDFDDHSELFGGTVKTDRTMTIEQCAESDSDSTLHGLGLGWHFTDFNVTFSFFLFLWLPLIRGSAPDWDVIIRYNIPSHHDGFSSITTFFCLWQDISRSSC